VEVGDPKRRQRQEVGCRTHNKRKEKSVAHSWVTSCTLALREKHTAETRPHEEQRRTDHVSLSSRLILQSHLKCASGCISNYYILETRLVRACLPLWHLSEMRLKGAHHRFDCRLGPL
jgi:hypothetical protein